MEPTKLSPGSSLGFGRWARAGLLGALLLAIPGCDRKTDSNPKLRPNPPDVVVIDPAQRAKAALSSVVELHWDVINPKTGERQPAKGSGFWIQDAKGEWLVATAGHNLTTLDRKPDEPDELRENIVVLVYPPEKQPKEPIRAIPLKPARLENGKEAISPSPDFAVLRIDQPGFAPPKGTRPMVFRDLNAEPLVNGEFVAILGSPEMQSFIVTTSVVHNPHFQDDKIDPLPLIAVKPGSRPGNSGGPAVDARGRVIGILSKGQHAGKEDIGFLVPNTQTLPLLQTWIDFDRP